MNRPGLARAVAAGVLLHATIAVAHGAEAACPTRYNPLSKDDLLDEFERSRPVTVSIFALLADHGRFLSRTVDVTGMLVLGHGRAFIVPAGEWKYVFTRDRVEVRDHALPSCLLQALDRKLVTLTGVLGEHAGLPQVEKVLVLGELPAMIGLRRAEERENRGN